MNCSGTRPAFSIEETLGAQSASSRFERELAKLAELSVGRSTAATQLDAHLVTLRAAMTELSCHSSALPPRHPGIRGDISYFLKRVMQRCSYWYIEPRWNTQRVADSTIDSILGALRIEVDRCIDRLDALERNDTSHKVELLQKELDALRQEVSGVGRAQAADNRQRIGMHQR